MIPLHKLVSELQSMKNKTLKNWQKEEKMIKISIYMVYVIHNFLMDVEKNFLYVILYYLIFNAQIHIPL